MPSVVISTKGWVVIPKKYRVKYDLQPGQKVQIVDYGGSLSIIPMPEDPIAALRGMFAKGPSLTEALLAEKQNEKAKEEARIGSIRSG